MTKRSCTFFLTVGACPQFCLYHIWYNFIILQLVLYSPFNFSQSDSPIHNSCIVLYGVCNGHWLFCLPYSATFGSDFLFCCCLCLLNTFALLALQHLALNCSHLRLLFLSIYTGQFHSNRHEKWLEHIPLSVCHTFQSRKWWSVRSHKVYPPLVKAMLQCMLCT
ncbi:hypothetical protein F5051DRAFT_90375 [Lentinula edodes]|nr:hypothetical protein F5051DRAFT_90375 [Lentinula edodes]